MYVCLTWSTEEVALNITMLDKVKETEKMDKSMWPEEDGKRGRDSVEMTETKTDHL